MGHWLGDLHLGVTMEEMRECVSNHLTELIYPQQRSISTSSCHFFQGSQLVWSRMQHRPTFVKSSRTIRLLLALQSHIYLPDWPLFCNYAICMRTVQSSHTWSRDCFARRFLNALNQAVSIRSIESRWSSGSKKRYPTWTSTRLPRERSSICSVD